MAEAETLVAAARAYASTSGLEGKLAAAADLQKLVLAYSPRAVASAIKARPDKEYVRAVLTAARPGLAAPAPSAQDASRLAVLRLVAYKATLALLGAQPVAAPPEGSNEEGGDTTVVAVAAAAASLTERQAVELVSVLDTELGSNTRAADLSEIAGAALEAFEGDAPLGFAALELLPKSLALLQAAGGEVDVPREDGDGAMGCDVSDACRGFILRIIQHSWPPPSIGRVLASLRAFPLTQQNLKEAVKKAGLRAKLADAQDLPAVVHQLLMLSTRGCRELILSEIMRLFEHKEAAVADSAIQRRQLLEVQGAVLLHMDMAVKHDVDLGQTWLRQLRGDTSPRLSPFALAASFMLAGIQRFEQPVINALKSLVLGAYKDAAMLSACPWLPFPSSRVAAASGVGQAAALCDALLQCACNSGHGQSSIVQPMVTLAVSLIEAGGSGGGGAAGKGLAAASATATAAGGSVELDAASSAPPAQRAASLGARLLLELFESHRDFQRDIISLCHNRLIGAKEEVAAPYVRLLALLVRRNQATIGDYMTEMKLSLEHLAFLPPRAALALLLAVWPLCRSRRDVQDYFIMLLRKAMFSRELHARLLAARGFLYMITQELQNGGGAEVVDPTFVASEAGPSQVSMSQLSSLSGSGSGGATLLHEVMSFLRRCLTQQPEVRQAVYEGMPALLAADPSVQDCVVEPLLPHFLQFYEPDEQLLPVLKLEACAHVQGEGVRLVEPLPHLLAATRRVLCAPGPSGRQLMDGGNAGLLQGPQGAGADGSATSMLRACFASLRRRLGESTLESFVIDAKTDFCLATADGQLSHSIADVLLGCMEVCMEDLVEELTGGRAAGGEGAAIAASQEHAEVGAEALGQALLDLHDQHRRLVNLVADGTKGAKGKKVEGLTQAVGSTKRGPGRSPAGTVAPSAAQQAAVVPVDKRVPALSLGCLAKILDAVADDGFRLPDSQASRPATMAAALKLCRNNDFITFSLTAALRCLHACEASELAAAISTGTAGSEADAASVRQLFAVPKWQQLARPLFRAAQTVLLSHCKSRALGGAGGAGSKKEKDPTETMTQAAARALHQLLAMGSSGGLAGLAAVLEQLPAPSAAAFAEAGLPSAEGLSAAQRPLAAMLPLFHELMEVLLKPSCSKELEQLCCGLALLAGVMPPAFADTIAGWAVEGLESLSGLTQAPAAKALLQLALRGRAAAALAGHGAGAGDGDGVAGGGNGGDGDDLALLLAVATDVKGMVNAEEMGEEGERFAAMTARTYLGMLGVAGSHLDTVLSDLEWMLAKVKSLAAAARDDSQGSADCQRLEATRQAWERAVLLRLRNAAEVLVVLCDTRLTGSPCEALLKSLIRLYKLLGVAAKTQLPARSGCGKEGNSHAVSGTFSDLVAWVNQDCTPNVYNFLQEVHGQHPEEEGQQENEGGENEEEDNKKAKKRTRAGAAATSKVPNLIFQIEEYERHLIHLSQAGKVNLMVTARRAVNRDFRIKLAPKQQQGEEDGQRGKRCRQQAQAEEEEQEEEQEEGMETEGAEEEYGGDEGDEEA